MNIPLTNPPHPLPTDTWYGPNKPSKPGDSTSWNRNLYQRPRRRISKLDGKQLIMWPAAIVTLSDEARGIKEKNDDEFIIYDRFARPKKLNACIQRRLIG
jgi:hypothetical protein